MNKLHIYILMIALLFGACSENDIVVDIPNQEPSTDLPIDATKGELLIKFKPEMTDILDRTLATRSADAGPSTRSGIPSTDEILEILNTYHFERVFPVDPRNEARTRESGMHLWYLVKFDENSDTKEAADKLSKLGEISKIQFNKTIQRAYSTAKKPILTSKVGEAKTIARSANMPFNDPELYKQWGYINSGTNGFEQDWAKSISGADVNAEEAWKISTGDPSIIVAVLDEGVMWSHPDLEANMWVNESEQLHAGQDADGNGYEDDRYGYNFVKNSAIISWTSDYDVGHGTHVAGTIAAVNGNGEGVSGIAGGRNGEGGVKIMSLQLFDGEYGATLANEAKAIKYAADNGAVILQCSWGYNSALSNMMMYEPGPGSEAEWERIYPLEKEALDYFINNAGSPNGVMQGGLAIFASGNEYSAMASYPSAYSKMISVGALAADYTPSSFTNYGHEVDLSAPGGDTDYYGTPGTFASATDIQGSIYSTLVIDGQAGYGYMDGTSMACPAVSGVAALGLSYAVEMRRHFTADEFRKLLISTSRDLDQYYVGEKGYHYNHTLNGSPFTKMDLSQYRGKMGKLVDAGALLKAIEGSGSEMKVPNVYVAPEKEMSMDLSKYFSGDKLSYSATVTNNDVASITINGSIMTVKGLATGSTSAIVKSSNGKENAITITVRKSAGDNGWM